MAKIATLIDDFQDGVIDAAKWGTIGTVSETGGRIRITPTTSFSYFATLTRTYDLTDSQVITQIPVITANGATGSLQSGMAVDIDANNLVGIRKIGSQLVCSKKTGGVSTDLSFTPYNSVNHLFWRIRADSTNVYWETSSTGTGAFFIQHTASIASLGFAITATGLFFFSGYSGVEAFPGTFQIEAVNPGLPFAATGASTSSGSLDLIATAPGEFAASGSSTSDGSLTFTLVLPGTINLSATGASTSTGNLDLTLLSLGTLAFVSDAASTSTGALSLSIAADAESLSDEYYTFEPPIAYDLPPTLPNPRPRYINAHARWKGGQRRGRSVLKLNGAYVTIDTPTVDQTHAATELYQGGHVYIISTATAEALVAAGYSVTAAPIAWTVYPLETLYPAGNLYPGYNDLVFGSPVPEPPPVEAPTAVLPSPTTLPSPLLIP